MVLILFDELQVSILLVPVICYVLNHGQNNFRRDAAFDLGCAPAGVLSAGDKAITTALQFRDFFKNSSGDNKVGAADIQANVGPDVRASLLEQLK